MTMSRSYLMKKLRVEKAIEIKSNFLKLLNKSMDEIVELDNFSRDINDWVENNDYSNGNIYITCLNKYIIYQLDALEHTVVKVIDTLPE